MSDTIDTIIKRLNSEIKKIEGDIQRGLTLSALMVKKKAMLQTPVDVGNLVNSCYVVAGDGTQETEGKFDTKSESGKWVADNHGGQVAEAADAIKRVKNKAMVEIGFTAFYAIYVHENLTARHTTGNAKFLENAIREETPKIPDIVKRYAKR